MTVRVVQLNTIYDYQTRLPGESAGPAPRPQTLAAARVGGRGCGSDGGVQRIAVHSGFVEVSDNHVALLSDVAELAEDIDIERAKNALDRANEILAGDSENEEASMALQRAEVRLLAADVA